MRTIQEIERMVELARSHYDSGGVGAAGAYYRVIMRECSPPKSGKERLALGEAYVYFARKAVSEKKIGEASDWYWKAIQADPMFADYRIEMAKDCLMEMMAPKMALIQANIAVKLEPENSKAWRILGIVHHALHNVKESYEAHRREIECAPEDPYAKLNLATVALDVADYDTVTEMANSVIGTDAKGDALHLLAMVAYREGRHEDSIELYDRAIRSGVHDPALAEWNKSLPLHSIGRYKEGWKASQARFLQKTDSGMAKVETRFARPVWDPTQPPARVHLHHEMGFGDVIAMSRYIPLVERLGNKVSVEINESMIGLMRRSFPTVNVVSKAIDYPGAIGIPDFDSHVPMLSLPAIFETDIDTVPWSGSYIVPDAQLVRHYAEKIKSDDPVVGLCWSSGIRHEGLWLKEYGMRKSMSFEDLWRAIYSIRGAKFLSLQADQSVTKFVNCIDRIDWPSVQELFPEKLDWDHTAAIVANCHLVVTVDTSVAHLAGAMGKPTWVMMHTEGSWHWMTKRLDSPWYPSARLFRQERSHEWGGVQRQIADELRGVLRKVEAA